MADHDTHDHTGVPGVGTAIADILDLSTAETDDTLVLAPDGSGGVEFRAETGGGGGGTNDLAEVAASALVDATSTGDAGSRADHFLGTSLDAAWVGEATAVAQGPTVKYSSVGLTMSAAASHHRLRAYTPSGAFRIEARVRREGSESNGFSIGLLVRDSSSGESSGEGMLFMINNGSGQLFSLDAGSFTSRQSTARGTQSSRWMYLAIERDGSNNWTGAWSLDRALWNTTSSHAKTFTVAKAGFRLSNEGVYAIDFFDVVS